MQKDARLKRFKTGRDSEESIQFRLYKVNLAYDCIRINLIESARLVVTLTAVKSQRDSKLSQETML